MHTCEGAGQTSKCANVIPAMPMEGQLLSGAHPYPNWPSMHTRPLTIPERSNLLVVVIDSRTLLSRFWLV